MPNVRLPQSSATLPRASKQYVYFFGDGKAEGHKGMKDILGGKGAGLAEMTNAGLPVPPGFHHPDRGLPRIHAERRPAFLPRSTAKMQAALSRLEAMMGRRLGAAQRPLLVSVRSGAMFSMPG